MARRGERPTLRRMEQIMVDTGLGQPARGYTKAERLWRAQVEREISEFHAKGGVVEIPFDLPDLD